MFPIGDDDVQGGGLTPLITWGLILLNVLAWMLELGQGSERALQSFVEAWGVVPREYTTGTDLPPAIPAPVWTTVLTSMFLHGGWMHLGGNMLYLWIFGDNLEKVMGHLRFLTFYLICGVAAAVAHIMFNANSMIPTVGASGAISGILGGYLLLFPRNRVRVLTRGGVAHVPALVVLGFWILHPVHQRHGLRREHAGDRRRGLHGAHRRVRRGPRAREAVRGRTAPGICVTVRLRRPRKGLLQRPGFGRSDARGRPLHPEPWVC